MVIYLLFSVSAYGLGAAQRWKKVTKEKTKKKLNSAGFPSEAIGRSLTKA